MSPHRRRIDVVLIEQHQHRHEYSMDPDKVDGKSLNSRYSRRSVSVTSSSISPTPNMILVLVRISFPPAIAPFLASSKTRKLCSNPALRSRTDGVHRSTVSTLCAKTSRPEVATRWTVSAPLEAKSGVRASTRMEGAFCLILEMVDAMCAAPPSPRSNLSHELYPSRRSRRLTVSINAGENDVSETPTTDRLGRVLRLMDIER
jgi:hypothetical protein